MGRGVFSQHKSTGRSWSHARTGEAGGQRHVPVLAVRGEWGAGSLCLPTGPPGHILFRLQPIGGFWWGLRPDGPTGQRGREANAPWSLPWKTGEACSACPSSCLWLALSIGPPSLPCPEAQWDPRRAGAAARALGFLGGRDRRCRLTPALPKPQLAVQSSVGGWEPVTEGQKGSGQGGQRGEGRAEDEDVHAHSGEVRGGHRFWQHCSLLGFCPSVVGGTLMSTTLLPGDSSCAARSAICFCDTMR